MSPWMSADDDKELIRNMQDSKSGVGVGLDLHTREVVILVNETVTRLSTEYAMAMAYGLTMAVEVLNKHIAGTN